MNQVELICQDWSWLDQIDHWIDPLSKGKLQRDSVFQEKDVAVTIWGMLPMLERVILHDRDWKLTPFCPDEERRTRIKPRTRTLNVKEAAELLSRTADPLRCPFTAGQLRGYLVNRGLLQYREDLKRYILTDRGRNGGLTESPAGDVSFPPQAQQLLLDNLDDLAAYCRDTWREECDGKYKYREVGPNLDGIPEKIKFCRALSRGEHPLTNAPLLDTDLACREEMKACFARVARVLKRVLELDYYSAKVPVCLSEEQWERIPITAEPCRIKTLVQNINSQLDPTAVDLFSVEEMQKLLERIDTDTREAHGIQFMPCDAESVGYDCDVDFPFPLDSDNKVWVWHYTPEGQRYMISLLKEKMKRKPLNQARVLLRARDYLDRINYWTIDPLSWEPLPEDSILVEEDIHRAIFSAAWALARIIAYDQDWERSPTFVPDARRRKRIRPDKNTVNKERMVAILNMTCDFTKSGEISTAQLQQYLRSEGYLQCKKVKTEGVLCQLFRYTPTPLGESIGLEKADQCTGCTESEFEMHKDVYEDYVIYTPRAQQFLLDDLDRLEDYCRGFQSHQKSTLRKKMKVNPANREKYERRIEIFQALSQGLHPTTHQPLPPADPACQEKLKTCFGYVARALERALELGYYSAKADFFLPRAQWEKIPIEEPGSWDYEFLSAVNRLCPCPDLTAVERLSFETLCELLRAEGLMQYGEPDADRPDDMRYVPTEKGKQLGFQIGILNLSDDEYKEVVYYSPEAQRHILSLLERYVKD